MNLNKKSLIVYLITNGINVPHYCYHNTLSIAGNCRVCLVEFEKTAKPIVSCATTADVISQTKTKIFHDSPLIKKARENVLEFLLLNHPLDCPICDQGGDCDLQDQSLFFGFVKRRFYKFKKFVSDKELGLIVKTVMTRCIHCTRCVRFLSEIAATNEFGTFGRGGSTQIGTYVSNLLLTELAGNLIELCPVGFFNIKI
jgi:NADH dehydrogenase (ubiquinone) Fe-S protein 1